jgi:glycine/D-amino acid oxidase-like deaminating enzyme
MDQTYSVGIIGGGISGAVTALHLANAGVDCILLEQRESLVSGPPFCHLHAGGNLYPDISDQQCRLLLRQSIESARFFPQAIDQRPTFLSIPQNAPLRPAEIHRRLTMLKEYYQSLIQEDPSNQILGPSREYFQAFSREELESLAKRSLKAKPKTHEEWMRNTLEVIDLEQLQTPVFMVQEYGWNMFRLAAGAQLALEETEHCEVRCRTKVTCILDLREDSTDHNWEIQSGSGSYKVNFLVNAGGYQTREVEALLGLSTPGWIEFKASYLTQWSNLPCPLPELIFHGERGTPEGMAQLTPNNGGYFQIHGMSEGITLFPGGLKKVSESTGGPPANQPLFNPGIMSKLQKGWDQEEIELRTNRAIGYIGKYVPDFHRAEVGGPPLYGAQQIVGEDSNLRVAEVSFPQDHYARIDTIKASSALSAAGKILDKILEQEPSQAKAPKQSPQPLIEAVPKSKIDSIAKK